jgi:hypothetical protein
MTSRRASDLDSPWKEALEHFLIPFLAFFFPKIHAGVDWSRGYQSLDKELHQIIRGSKVGRRLADKLFKVWRKDGEKAWLLIHIEVQGRREEQFPERMFTYCYRIFDVFHRPVVSLAVLCDADPRWRPDHFGYNIWDCEVALRFPVAKLLDYRGQEQSLEVDPNPFAPLVLAQLKAMETDRAPEEWRTWKLRLIKGLYERNLKAEDIRQLFRLIDWMLSLPEGLEEGFLEDVYRFEQERQMPYITSFERLGIKRGHQKGLEEGLEKGLEKGLRDGLIEGIAMDMKAKFGSVNKPLLADIRALNISQIRKVARAMKKAKNLNEIRRLL